MADNKTGLNAQYSDPPFGLSSGIGSTGAPGSSSLGDPGPHGPVVGSPQVSVPGASSQLPQNMPVVDVTAGDTAASSWDSPVPPIDPMTGLQADSLLSTGSGSGHVGGPPHPNSANGRGPEVAS